MGHDENSLIMLNPSFLSCMPSCCCRSLCAHPYPQHCFKFSCNIHIYLRPIPHLLVSIWIECMWFSIVFPSSICKPQCSQAFGLSSLFSVTWNTCFQFVEINYFYEKSKFVRNEPEMSEPRRGYNHHSQSILLMRIVLMLSIFMCSSLSATLLHIFLQYSHVLEINTPSFGFNMNWIHVVLHCFLVFHL